MEEEVDLREYLRVLSRRKGIIILLFFVTMLAAFVATRLMTPIYQASTTILVNGGSRLENPFLTGITGIGKSEVQNAMEILRSRTLSEQVAKKLWPTKTVSANDPDPLKNVEINIQAVPGTDMIKIKVESPKPGEARDIANALVEAYSQESQRANRIDSHNARQFIETQLGVVEKELQKAEGALRAYKEREGIYSPGEEIQVALERVSKMEISLAETKVAMEEVRTRLAEVRKNLADQDVTVVSATTITQNPSIQEYKSRLSELEVQLAGALEKYTRNHPAVLSLNSEIAVLKEKIGHEVERVVSGETHTINPIRQGLSQELIRLQTEELALEVRYDAQQKLSRQMEGELAGLPKKEFELTRLMRDAKVSEGIYMMLKQKHEEVRITESMRSGDVKVIDAAVTPEKPIRPRKLFNMVIAAFLGLMAGVIMAFVLEFLDTTIKDHAEAEKVLKLPVLGQIPAISTIKAKRRQGRRRSRTERTTFNGISGR
ncbi:MAG: GumC family protein [Syntrophothermus sp.]